jgi:hypothetical protein
MLCKNPFYKDGIPFGCGQCTPCRINKRRLWTHRIVLESKLHRANSFVTLTYDKDHIPLKLCNDGKVRGELQPDHLSGFVKRLRRKYEPLKLRFLGVGEYGDETQRPHYHLALFGYPSCAYGVPRVTRHHGCQCPACLEIQDAWKYGHTYNGQLNKNSAAYIAGYVTKKMTFSDSDLQEKLQKLTRKNKNGLYDESIKEVQKAIDKLQGRKPEFARMSNRPGIAAGAMDFLADVLEDGDISKLAIGDDVPDILQTDGKKQPLGRYLKQKLREKLGYEETGCPEKVLSKMRFEQAVETYALWHEKGCPSRTSQKELLLEANSQKVKNTEKRFKLYSQKRSV